MRTLLATLHSKYIHNSLALPCLAAFCGPACGELLIGEYTVHEPREALLAALLDDQPDVIAFSVYLWNRSETFALIDALAVAAPRLQLVVGGPEVSYEDESLFARHPGLTAMVRGEGERPLKALLSAWAMGEEPGVVPRLIYRSAMGLVAGPDGPPLEQLDLIPSPFAAGLVDPGRGFVYYETSRGCPFRCSFCLSARDNHVRSYSMDRIRADLDWLMDHEVPKIKLVDRTFNYDAARAYMLFAYILEHNRSSHFHFEIAAHLLDEATLALLVQAPPGTFQFEIGVQSTLEQTLSAVNRNADLTRLEANVRHLGERSNVELHLDLVAGLPGENYEAFIASIDRVAALQPDHLQIEPVKLLPGSPLRDAAEELGIRFDPHPPYTVLATQDLEFMQLRRLTELSRLLDLTYNSGCMPRFLGRLTEVHGSFAGGLEDLSNFWREQGLFRKPLGRRELFDQCWRYLAAKTSGLSRKRLKDALAHDYAGCERVVLNRVPEFFDTVLTEPEQTWVRASVQAIGAALRGQGVKLQYFAAAFHYLDNDRDRSVRLFVYRTRSGVGMTVGEHHYPEIVTAG